MKKWNTNHLKNGEVQVKYEGNLERLNLVLYEADPQSDVLLGSYRYYFIIDKGVVRCDNICLANIPTAAESEILTMDEWNKLTLAEKIEGHSVLVEDESELSEIAKLTNDIWFAPVCFKNQSFSCNGTKWTYINEPSTLKASDLIQEEKERESKNNAIQPDPVKPNLSKEKLIEELNAKRSIPSIEYTAGLADMYDRIFPEPIDYVPENVFIADCCDRIGIVNGNQALLYSEHFANYSVICGNYENINNGKNFKYIECAYSELKSGDLFRFNNDILLKSDGKSCWFESGVAEEQDSKFGNKKVKKIVKI